MILYSNYLLDDYINPKSKALEYIVNNWDNPHNNNYKQMLFLNSKNNLIILQLKNN